MRRILMWKSIVIVVAVLCCLLAITGIPSGLGWQAWKASTLARIHLGLDLQGGTHMILTVNVNDAVRTETTQAIERLQQDLTAKGIGFTSLTQPDPQNHPEIIQIQGVPANRAGDFNTIAQNDLGANYEIHELSATSYSMTLLPAEVADIKNHAVDQTIETISERINQLGVTEPTVQRHGMGDYQILVQLPGITDSARVKQVMSEQAMLEIRLVAGGPFASESDALSQYGGVLPAGDQILPGNNIGGTAGTGSGYYVLSRVPVVTGQDLRTAQAATGNTGGPIVQFTLTTDAGRRFGEFTQANVGKDLAVVLDNRVVEAAVIEGRIEDQGEIEGSFTRQQASDLAMILRSGALPASITPLDEEVVGPSLGADSIHEGIIAALTGFLVVAGFMLFYYHGAGVNAVLALVLNLVILMAYMAMVQATLTLPGIAGIILTIGMAVDSNVLIFERIREEIRHGKSIPAAVDIGFRQAFITIVDTHVTTVVSAMILFFFGTGPIKGFAITLTAGLIANLFTAVFISRVIFDYVLLRQQQVRGARLSI